MIPKNIVIEKYFSSQKEELEKLQEDLENTSQQMQTMNEENQGDDDLFSEVRDEEKINKKDIPKRIKEIKDDPEFTEEFKALQEYLRLSEQEKELKDKIKSGKEALNKVLLEKFRSLQESEIKEIVIHDKWIFAIHHSINDELERISHKLYVRCYC